MTNQKPDTSLPNVARVLREIDNAIIAGTAGAEMASRVRVLATHLEAQGEPTDDRAVLLAMMELERYSATLNQEDVGVDAHLGVLRGAVIDAVRRMPQPAPMTWEEREDTCASELMLLDKNITRIDRAALASALRAAFPELAP